MADDENRLDVRELIATAVEDGPEAEAEEIPISPMFVRLVMFVFDPSQLGLAHGLQLG